MDDRAFDSISYVREIFIYSELYSCICRPCNINFYFQRRISRKQFQFRRVRFLFRGRSAVETAARLTSMNQSILQNRATSQSRFICVLGWRRTDGRTSERTERRTLKREKTTSECDRDMAGAEEWGGRETRSEREREREKVRQTETEEWVG